MSISIGPNPVLDDLILWYDAANTKCYSGEPTTNQISSDYVGESGLATGNASVDLSGLFGFGLVSKEPFAHEVWSLDNINKGKLTRYNSYYFDGVNDYLEVADDDAFTFGQDNVSTYTSDFSAGVDGWTAAQGTADGNIDSIGGENDNLRLTIDSTNGNHRIEKSLTVTGKYYKVSFDYYIPSSNSHLNNITARWNNGAFDKGYGSTQDAWTEFSFEGVADDGVVEIYAADDGSITVNDAGGDDVLYIRNIQITEIKDDLPFSVSAWVKAEDWTNFGIVGLYANSTNAEWLFYTSGDDLAVYFNDTNPSNRVTCRSLNTITSYENEWVHVSATYGGSGPNSEYAFTSMDSSVRLYINGEEVAQDTPDKIGTYTGMQNTSNALNIGRFSTAFGKGHIRNVKIFNRELNAGEVYQLYYSNSLNGVIYAQDATPSGEWAAQAGSVSDEAGPIVGKSNVLGYTIDTTLASHYARLPSVFTVGKRYRVSFDYLVDAGNDVVTSVRVYDGSFYTGAFTPTAGTWNRVTVELTPTISNLRIYPTIGTTTSIQDPAGDDIIYIDNLNIVELDTNSEVDFVEEWGEANGATYTQDATPSGNWTGINGTDADEAGPIGGVTDVLKFTVDTSLSNHSIALTALTSGKRYRVSGSAYIPSANSNIDGFRVGTSASTTLFGNETSPTQDTWVAFSGEGVANDSTLRIYVQDGGVVLFQDAGGDDVIYFHNITVTQIGTLADFDLSNYDDNDKITDKSTNKFVASPQGGALARDRWTPYSLAFSKDKDNNDIATITRDPSSGAFFENTDKLTLYGEYPLYVSNASTGDKVSVSFEAKSNITGLFTGLNFFNSGTSAAERVWLNRVLMPDNYEYYYGTSNLIATGDNVGFTVLMNRDFSSGWNSISLRKPQIELKDHATNFIGTSRSGVNAIVNLANRSLYTGTMVNDVKSSGISKIDGVQSFYPLNGGYWEFNGVDTNINTNYSTNNIASDHSFEFVFSAASQGGMIFGNNSRPSLQVVDNSVRFSALFDGGASQNFDTVTTVYNNTIYHILATLDTLNKTGSLYLNGQFEIGYSFNSVAFTQYNFFIGDRADSSVPLDGKIYLARIYSKALTSGEVYRNYRAIKTKYGL